MNTIQKIGLAILSLIAIGVLIFINIKKKAKAAVNDAIVNSKRRKLATNEKRYYGTPYSTFDLIKTTDTLKEINRKRYKFIDGSVEMIVTSDPDNDSMWEYVSGIKEVYFTKDYNGVHDFLPDGASIKSMASVKGGVIYQAEVHSKYEDDAAGLMIQDSDGVQLFYIAYEGKHLNVASLKI